MTVPERNVFLSALGEEDFEALLPKMKDLDVRQGQILCEAGHEIEFVYFPKTCAISVVALLEDGTPEMANFGPEGVAGALALLGHRKAFGRYLVQMSGRASRIRLDHLETVLAQRPHLRATMNLYLQWILNQVMQTAACNAAHHVEARCCRWILTLHERLHCKELDITHDILASAIGVQRPTVSVIARRLQNAGLIQQRRGAIAVVDAHGLENSACECYHTLQQRFEQILRSAESIRRARRERDCRVIDPARKFGLSNSAEPVNQRD
ncbi:Crp/Fnr family transcriptional regulator [Methylobacterium sp. CB376]|uniref:Crp/Fnr family transcriptional regulator n=1 Tax=unclassified Methylobacterium TaxID=2615210 RepID=UPI00143C17FD|nr:MULTISPECIES: Crp/Fnr family transcriptional regulator [Methylobacterium]WFT81678.1 Crp/Fnr family transcriptional regulator [Methylobacterium nodulans]